MKDARERLSHPCLILLHAEEGLSLPLGSLARLLAETIHADFGDKVAVVHLAEPDKPVPAKIEANGVLQMWIAAPLTPGQAVAEIAADLAQLGLTHPYVFLDASSRAPRFAAAMAHHLVATELGELSGRLVHLTRKRTTPDFPKEWSVLRTDVLGAESDAATAPPPSLRRTFSAATALASRELSRITRQDGGPHSIESPTATVYPEPFRIRLDTSTLARSTDAPLARLSPSLRTTLSRWARAVTSRRVGVALGGSGAWGYAHIALLLELEDAGIPVDLVASSSSGSLMGAYYAALGRPGLDLAVKRARDFQRMAMLALFTSSMIEARVDLDLGALALEDLEMVFLPVTTNLTLSRSEIVDRGTIGFGVRASGTAPGLFASTIAGGALYVDGCITDNVPAVLLERMGAALVIAANALPAPRGVELPAPRSTFTAVVEELSPFGRIIDVIASLSLLAHDIGDVEARSSRVRFDPPDERYALFRAFEFARAEEIMAHVREEKEFKQAVQDSKDAWAELKRPRVLGVSP